MSNERFVGAWALDHAEARNAEGELVGPLFDGWTGQIMHSADGRMGVHLMAPDRPALPFARMPEAAAVTDAEKGAAFDSFTGYWGSYSVDDATGVVTHALSGISRGVAAGTEFPRHFEIEGDMLTLNPPAAYDEGRSYIFWRRVST